MKERVQKILASRGVASRRAVEEMIAAGRVTCNGKVCILGDTADAEIDTILLDGKAIPEAAKHVYLMLHKPKGYVTTMSDEKGRKDVSALIKDCPERVFPVGRLDMDSEGLLLFTNDGAFANKLMHPSHEVEKTYSVQVVGYSPDALTRLGRPIILDGYRIKPPEIQTVEASGDLAHLLITIHEGRNRQVRRMCAAADMKVRRLVRVREGSLKLGDLPKGKWRYLTDEEVAMLK